MKFKKLTKSQIIISIDRLTRFKPTSEKYLRVFRDIILSCLIEPRYKKSDIENMDFADIRDIATDIFNSSLNNTTNDFVINDRLKIYENNIFNNDKNTQKLLNNKLDYKSALELIDINNCPINLKWLYYIGKDDVSKEYRNKYDLLFPIEKVVIAEGITEEILLPEFAKFCGYNFDKNGVKIIAAGGKNQVVKLYYKMCEEVKLPIFILLDKDAESNEELINTKLRKQDKVYLLNSGEFEDLLPKRLIKKTINNEMKNFVKIRTSDLDSNVPMVKVLEEFFKEQGLHEFKKAEFANQVKQQINSETDISDEVRDIIEKIKLIH